LEPGETTDLLGADRGIEPFVGQIPLDDRGDQAEQVVGVLALGFVRGPPRRWIRSTAGSV